MENTHFYNRSFSTFGEALDFYLENELGRGANREVANRLVRAFEDNKKKSSWAAQIGQWRNGNQKAQDHNIDKLNEVLNVHIGKDKLGKWIISRTKRSQANESTPRYRIDELLKEERSRLGIEDIPDTDRGRELQDMLDDAVSLLLKIRRSIEMEKRRAGD